MERITTSNGINWNYDLQGDGPSMLFLHGWGVDRRIWRQQFKHFINSHRVLSPDLPGHGDSSWQKLSLDQMVSDLSELLERLGIRRTTVIGSSLGGLFGLKLYALAPQKVSSIVFVGSMPKFAKTEDYPYGLDIAQMRKLERQLQTAYPSIVHIFFRSLFTKQERETRRYRWIQIFRKTEGVPMMPALKEYLDVLETEDLREEYRKISVPFQLVSGAEDPICTKETFEYLSRLKPDAGHEVFEQCGHFPFLTKPSEFNDVLERFLKKFEQDGH